MTETEARAALRDFDKGDGMEAWIAGQTWQAEPDGWTVAGDLDGWCFRLRCFPGGFQVSAIAPGGRRPGSCPDHEPPGQGATPSRKRKAAPGWGRPEFEESNPMGNDLHSGQERRFSLGRPPGAEQRALPPRNHTFVYQTTNLCGGSPLRPRPGL
jgi:hypothetical protein